MSDGQINYKNIALIFIRESRYKKISNVKIIYKKYIYIVFIRFHEKVLLFCPCGHKSIINYEKVLIIETEKDHKTGFSK